MELLCSNGYTTGLRLIHEYTNVQLTDREMNIACKNGQLNVVRYLQSLKISPTIRLEHVLLYGKANLEIIQLVYENNTTLDSNTIDILCITNVLDCNQSDQIIDFLYEKGLFASKFAIEFACLHGRLDILKFVTERDNIEITEKSILLAAMNGHLDVLKWLIGDTVFIGGDCSGIYKNDKNIMLDALFLAYSQKRMDIVDFLKSHCYNYLDEYVEKSLEDFAIFWDEYALTTFKKGTSEMYLNDMASPYNSVLIMSGKRTVEKYINDYHKNVYLLGEFKKTVAYRKSVFEDHYASVLRKNGFGFTESN